MNYENEFWSFKTLRENTPKQKFLLFNRENIVGQQVSNNKHKRC